MFDVKSRQENKNSQDIPQMFISFLFEGSINVVFY